MIESMMLLSVGAVTSIRMSVFNTDYAYSHIGPAASMCISHASTIELTYDYAVLRVAKRCLLDSVCMLKYNRPRCVGQAIWLC